MYHHEYQLACNEILNLKSLIFILEERYGNVYHSPYHKDWEIVFVDPMLFNVQAFSNLFNSLIFRFAQITICIINKPRYQNKFGNNFKNDR